MLAPTRRLRAQHVTAAVQSLDLEQVFPAGADEEGADLYSQHRFRIIEKHATSEMDRLDDLEQRVKQATQFAETHWLLSEHQWTIYDVYFVRAPEALSRWGSNGCVAIATHDYFLKVCADPERLPDQLKSSTGAVFLDEADEAGLITLLAAASGEEPPPHSALSLHGTPSLPLAPSY